MKFTNDFLGAVKNLGNSAVEYGKGLIYSGRKMIVRNEEEGNCSAAKKSE